MAPKYSIAIPAYNRHEYLRSAIASCLAQTIGDFEVVVSDNCSEDDLVHVVRSFDDHRIHYSRSDTQLGAVRNHARAVALSSGEYVVNLHSDDMLLPGYLAEAGAALDDCPKAAAVYSALVSFKDQEVTGCQPLPKLSFVDREVFLANPWLEKNHNVSPTSCMFRRSSYEKIGGYRQALRFAYDWDLYLRFVTLGGGVLFLPRILAVYRQHDGQAVRTLAHEGLYDVLDLWGREEYTHWPAWEIADLVITHLRASRNNASDRAAILERIRHNNLGTKLIWGGLGAAPRRVLRHLGLLRSRPDFHYRMPDNVDSISPQIRVLLEH